MPAYDALKCVPSGLAVTKDRIGGNPILGYQTPAPLCRNCGAQMLSFFQFDIQARFFLPFLEGSHLVVLMCPQCNEIPSFSFLSGGQLPREFWNFAEGHFFSALYLPSAQVQEVATLQYLQTFELDFRDSEERNSVSDIRETFRIGGEPKWLQKPMSFICQCRSEMKLICQLPENLAFPKQPSAPEQPDSFSKNDYCLFLGNEIYVFGCPEQCSERAIWIAVQN